MVACRELRQLRTRFAEKFRDDAAAVSHFDKMTKRLTRGVCKLAGKNAELYQRYVLGMPATSFRFKLISRNLKTRLLRARFHAGRWRRNLLGSKS